VWDNRGTPRLQVMRSAWGSENVIEVSCGGSGAKGWRTELEPGCSKSLEDHLRAATDSAKVDSAAWLAPLLVRIAMAGLRGVVESEAAGEWRGGG
jgi:hypothetical protein